MYLLSSLNRSGVSIVSNSGTPIPQIHLPGVDPSPPDSVACEGELTLERAALKYSFASLIVLTIP